jgi:uncharacterized protein YjiS (DUF1127 family)
MESEMIDVLENFGAVVCALPESSAWMPISRGVAACLTHSCDVIALWRGRTRSRRELLKYDRRMLADIGLTEADAWHEVRKWFWRH